MYTFERGTRVPLRGINLGVKKIIRAAVPNWEGDRVTVTFLTKVTTAAIEYNQRSNRKFVQSKVLMSVNLYSGQVSAYQNGRVGWTETVEADIDIGDACFFQTSA